MNDKKCYVVTKGKPAPDCVMVIFGAGGELTSRLLLPTLCHLGGEKLLSENFNVVGVAGHDYNDESFREYLLQDIAHKVHNREAEDFAKVLSKKVHYVQGRFENSETFQKLKNRLHSMAKKEHASTNYIFYLATPPSTFLSIIQSLHALGLFDESEGFRRVIVEKPFGHDLDSAIELNSSILELIEESQVYRIDHYLGKETVQNLLAFRFANGIFEPIWNHRYIDNVQITVAEESGIGTRGNYFEHAGALRDMLPNHLFQLLSLLAMEPPISFESRAVRDEKAKLLRSIKFYSPQDVLTNVVRAQYGQGMIGHKSVKAYCEEKNVDKNSITETYVALKLLIDNWRWAEVPFYLRTGKRLKKRVTEIAIQFKKAPSIMFQKTRTEELSPNLLVIHIQPEEGISLRFGAKVPGPSVRIGDVDMRFQYKDYFGLKAGTGYETLLYDCMLGDSTLYQRADMVETGWSVVQPILDVWNAIKPKCLPTYEAGSNGPEEADVLLEKDGHSWRNLAE
ncbi:MAG: glucose-6-phosphate dehydrogenase [Myxococcales bacterium]|nr:glucose-6-phosphate dehydrogenase [Myxococcales bacterium]USN50057.1 MAG: glucose-6-phosphate dehydrogenase [Myxococcales bacterium]